jgi:hypothetical protein
MHKINRLLAMGIALITAIAAAQTAPTTSPTTSATGPATTRRARWQMTMPAGFVKVLAGERVAICDPADQTWVKEALPSVVPATKPSTMPADLIGRVNDHRAALVKLIAADFGISDSSKIDQYFDQTIIPDLHKLQDFRPPIFFMPIERQKLKELVKAGWGEPKFYYNRVADDVAFVATVALSTDGMDDYVMPLIYDPSDPIDLRQKRLRQVATELDASVVARIATQGQATLQQDLIHFIDQTTFAPLQLKNGSEWFGVGIEGIYSARYVGMINDTPPEQIIRFMTRDDSGNPLRAKAIDLLHLTPPAQLRPQYGPFYFDAMRRKSMQVVNDWLTKAPADSTAKVLSAIAQQKPGDGEALVKIIKDVSGVDLSDAVKAK